MFFYAELNHENICIGVKMVSNEMDLPNHIPIQNMNEDYMYRKYENGQWSAEKFLPPTTEQEPLEDKIARIEDTNFILMDALATVYEEVLMLRAESGGSPK